MASSTRRSQIQTTATYNGVTIRDLLTDSIEHTNVKDSTGVDQLGVKVVATFTGIVHTAEQDHTGKRLASLQTGLQPLLMALSKDRRRFTMRIGGLVIYDVGPGAAEANAPANSVIPKLDQQDINNGPIPTVQVNSIIAGVSATIRFTIEFTIPNCGGTGATNNSGMTNFRFWIAEDRAPNGLVTRTYQGRLRVAHKNISPHSLAREITVPPLERGFQRRVIQLNESEDGLTLDFTYQDAERIAAAPWKTRSGVGAVDWSGQLTASTIDMGASGHLEMNLTLTGDKLTSKADLIDISFRVCQSKMRVLQAIQGLANKRASSFLESLSVTEELAENIISLQCRIRHTGDKNIIAGLLSVGPDQVLGRPLGDLGIGYDPEVHFVPPRSAGVGGVFLSVLQTPCNPAKLPPPRETKKQKQTSYSDVGAEEQPIASLPTATSYASQSHQQSIYLEYLMESEIFYNTGRVALATGAAKDSNADTLAIVNLHRPVATREIRIDASRVDAFPEIPSIFKDFSDANGIRHTVIGEPRICPSTPQLSADSRNLLYRVKMQALYAMSRPPKANESLPLGSVPYRTGSYSDPTRVIPASAFVDPANILR